MRKLLGFSAVIVLASCSPSPDQVVTDSATVSAIPSSSEAIVSSSLATNDWPDIQGNELNVAASFFTPRVQRAVVAGDTAYFYVKFRPDDVGGMIEAGTTPRDDAEFMTLPDHTLPDYAEKFVYFQKDADGQYLGSLTFTVDDLKKAGKSKQLGYSKLLSMATNVDFTPTGKEAAKPFCDEHKVDAAKFCEKALSPADRPDNR